MDRKYSYPNKFNLYFIEADKEYDKLIPETDDPIIIQEPEINESLILKENISCWKNNKTFEQFFDDKDDPDYKYLIRITENFKLMNLFREQILGKTGNDKWKFDKKMKRTKLISC